MKIWKVTWKHIWGQVSQKDSPERDAIMHKGSTLFAGAQQDLHTTKGCDILPI